MTRLSLLMLLALAACTNDSESDTDVTPTGDTDTDVVAEGQTHAVLTTVSADRTTGSFATISLDDWTVSDELFVTSGDSEVSADEGMVFQVNRFGTDTVRMYAPGEWSAPRWEKELADLSNPGAADVCGGSLFIALYGTDTLGVYDPATGNQTGAVDLSEFDDGDGSAEPGSLVEVDGKLYVGMNRLDRDADWVDAGGVVAEVDCATRAVTRSWPVGGNTSVFRWQGTDKVMVLARAFGGDVGGIYALDPATGVDHVVAVEGESFSGIAAVGDRAVAISLAADYSHYALHCVDLAGGAVESSAETASYYDVISTNDRGEAWITAGPSWIDETAPQGLFVYDVATCTQKTTAPITLSLAPKGLAFF